MSLKSKIFKIGACSMLLCNVAPTFLELGINSYVVYAQDNGPVVQYKDYPTDLTWDKWYQNGGQFDAEYMGKDVTKTYTVGEAGCFITSVAILAGRSGEKTVTFEGKTYALNPASLTGFLINTGALTDTGDLYSSNIKGFGGSGSSFKFAGDERSFSGMSKTNILAFIQKRINEGYYPVVGLGNQRNNAGGSHYVAVNRVDGDKLIINDPVTHSKASNKIDFEEAGYRFEDVIQVTWFEGKVKITEAEDAATSNSLKVENENGNIIDVGFNGKIPGLPERRDYKESAVILQLKDMTDPAKLDKKVLTDKSLTDWIEDNKRSSAVDAVDTSRLVIMVLGVFLLFYGLLFLLAWIVDRSVPLPIDVFTLVTFGKLAVSFTDSSTFRDKDAPVKEINAKTMMLITFLIWLVGTLIVSGMIYRIANTLAEALIAVLDFFKKSFGGS